MKTTEQNMWVSVLLQAVEDAVREVTEYRYVRDKKSGNVIRILNEDYLAKLEADVWLRKGGKDFDWVCQAAGMDSDYIREGYRTNSLNLSVIAGKRGRRKARAA